MNLLRLLVSLLTFCCTRPVAGDEAATACFGLSVERVEYYFTQESCLSYHEHELLGVLAVMGGDKMIRYDVFVRHGEGGGKGAMNSTSAHILFIPDRKNNGSSNVFIGFDLEGNTLVRASGDKHVTVERNSIFKLTMKSVTEQKIYAVIKSKGTLAHSHLKINLMEEKVAVLLKSGRISKTTEPLLMFQKTDGFGARKASTFSDLFIIFAIVFMVSVAVLMTVTTIASTVTSINDEKGKADGRKAKNAASSTAKESL